MSHLIIKPYDTVYCPEAGEYAGTWHGLQTNVVGEISPDGENIPLAFPNIFCAGFKIDLESPLSTAPAGLEGEMGENPMADWKAIVCDRSDIGKGIIPIHFAKAGYQIHGNRETFDALIGAAKEVCGAEGFKIATVGTLGANSQFFVSLAVRGAESFSVGKGDEHQQFFNLVSSHNALVASNINLGIVRVVCMNTVLASISQAENTGQLSGIRHTKNSMSLVTAENFARHLSAWLKAGEEHKNILREMTGVSISTETAKAFFAGVFTHDGSDKLSTVSYNRVNECAALFARGRGNEGKTLFDAFNGFTEFFTSGAGAGKATNRAKQIASANYGQGAAWKLQALECAKTEEVFAETCKRGEMLYADKESLVMSN
jgi:hypothetical protein